MKAKNTTRKGFECSVCASKSDHCRCQVVLLKQWKCPLLNRIFHLCNFTQHESYHIEIISLDKVQGPGTCVAIFCELDENFVAEAVPGAELGASHVYSGLSGWRKQAQICLCDYRLR